MLNSKIQELAVHNQFWSYPGPYSDVVLFSNISLLRNIFSVPFYSRQEASDYDFLISVAERFVSGSDYEKISLIKLNEIEPSQRSLLAERNIISNEMLKKDNVAVIIGSSKEEEFNILVNEENHFNIQSDRPGLQITEAFNIVNEIDDELNKYASYAYSSELGYITASPSSLGTGIKVLILMHLPVLSMTRQLSGIVNAAAKEGFKIVGIKDNGTKTLGSMFKLINDKSLGISGKELLIKLEKVCLKIIDKECEARDNLFAEYNKKLEDEICRSYGVIKYARILTFEEAMAYLSDIRLGIILSIIKDINLSKINELMTRDIQWAHLQQASGKYFSDVMECNIFRARYLREQLQGSSVYE